MYSHDINCARLVHELDVSDYEIYIRSCFVLHQATLLLPYLLHQNYMSIYMSVHVTSLTRATIIHASAVCQKQEIFTQSKTSSFFFFQFAITKPRYQYRENPLIMSESGDPLLKNCMLSTNSEIPVTNCTCDMAVQLITIFW